jgi:hypothetical protein
MTEAVPRTDIVIDGAMSHMARALILAAAEREDISVSAVIGDTPKDETGRMTQQQAYNHYINNDSVYGNYVRHHKAADRLHATLLDSANYLEHDGRPRVFVQLGCSAEQMARDYGDNGQIPERVVVTSNRSWNARTEAERASYEPIVTVKGLLTAHKTSGPLYVPDTMFMAAEPLLHAYRCANLQLQSIGPPAETASLVDNASGKPLDISDTRASASALLVKNSQLTIDEFEAAAWCSDGKSITSRPSIELKSISAPVAVGSILMVSSTHVTGRGMPRDTVFTAWSHSHEVVDYPLISAADVKGCSKIQIPHDQVKRLIHPRARDHKMHIITMFYDNEFFRAHRILDTAVALASV